MPRSRRFSLVCVAMLVATGCVAQPNPYREAADWVDFSGYPKPGNVSGVAVDEARDLIWITARCGANDCTGNTSHTPVIGIERDSGLAVAGTGVGGYFIWPHGIHVDEDSNIWVTDGRTADGRGNQVIKYAPNGLELMRIGEAGVTGDGPYQFSSPTDVAIASDGSIYVTDGHDTEANHRVMKFTPDGTFVMSFGEFGSGPGQFNVPHAIAIDSRDRLYVADRDNNRVQVFTADGEHIVTWTQFGRPSGIDIGADNVVYVSDNQSNDARNPGFARGIRVGNSQTGEVQAFIPDPDYDPAVSQESQAHGLAADRFGNIYGAEVWGQTVRKYIRR